MGKRRVYEIAKDLGIDSKDLVAKLQAIGVEVKSHSSTIDEDDLKRALAKPAEKKPEAKRPGLVVRKKVDIPVSAETQAAEAAAAAAEEERLAAEEAARAAAAEERRRQEEFEAQQAAAAAQARHEAAMRAVAEAEAAKAAAQAAAAAAKPAGSTTPDAPVAPSKPASGANATAGRAATEAPAAVASTSHAAAASAAPASTPSSTAATASTPAASPAAGTVASPATPSTAAPSTAAPAATAPSSATPAGTNPATARPATTTPAGAPGNGSPGNVARPPVQSTYANTPLTPRPGANSAGANAAGATASGSTAAPGTTPPGTTPPPGARVVRMIDRDKLISRIPPRRLPPSMGGPRPGGPSPGGWRPGGPPGARPGMGGPRPAGPGGLRPGPGSLEPQMGGMRYGQVKEIRVVTDAYGKGKEMVDVAKERAKKGPAGDEKRPRLDKRSLMQMTEHRFSPSRLKRRRGLKRTAVSTTATTMKASKRVVRMGETITPADLARDLSVKVSDVIRKLMELGVMATINQPLDFDTATLVCQAYDFTVASDAFDEDDYIDAVDEDGDEQGMLARPPVVTIMGHVDHGKTSLLDAIRNADVAAGEAGGITQHIGAYQVDTPRGKITFLDTPGHEAFTAMRARGAKVTDLVVLVVAADDGPMPQTVEAIRHAQAAEVPIIVAVNKIDKPGGKPDQIMQALTEFKLVPEEWGGDIMYVKTSALKKTGITELLDAILLQAEVMEIDSSPERRARGTVVEARLDKGFGPRVSVIVQDGTLRVGDYIVAGTFAGKVRSMLDDKGNQLKEAPPSTPVEIMGLEGVPNAGDVLNAVEDMDNAKAVAEHRRQADQEAKIKAKAPKVSMEDIMAKLKGTGAQKDFKVIVKADVQGSVEALRESLLKLATSEVSLTIIHAAVGAVTESDVMLASASDAMVVAFNTKADGKTRATADQEDVEIRNYNIIYNVLDDVRKAMGGLLSPTTTEKVLGRAQVRQIFAAGKAGNVAGCAVTDGKIIRSAKVRIMRDGKQVFEGKLASLKRFKEDAREVLSGFECGMMFDGYNDMKIDDVIEAFEMTEVARSLDNPPPAPRTPPRGGGAQAAAN